MKTYTEKDESRKPVEWDGLNCIMLGTLSEAGIIRRMDGSIVTAQTRDADPGRLCTFAATGQFIFDTADGYTALKFLTAESFEIIETV